ncbi:hypothetical protein C8A05DRAFT_35032 [Staphylotrichum tortipilum]|uniref:F-box domain-containing protein n=1 Tax=Staphylotrichum tortipilum TaxID=2831512 RepID=A0AAN6MI27_9PEZI|nr:hypothetical protein C8A05DRAFT_35032 [Staphylotrichum longicolle]
MGKGKGKGRGKNKPDKPDLAPQSAPYLSRTQRPAPHATIALTTYEILEAILLRVDEQTLLVSAQRVSTLWHRVMSTSVRLQRRLFFRSSPLPPPPPPGTTATITRNFNTFLKRTFPCLLPERNYCHWMLLPPFLRPPTTATTTDVTTMHNQLRLAPFRMAGYPSASSCWRPAILDARYAGTRRRAFARAGASWRRMLPADLAVRRVAVTSAVPGGGGVQEVVRVVEIVPGEEMTMGEYYDVVCDVNFRRRDGSGEWGEVQGVKGSERGWSREPIW